MDTSLKARPAANGSNTTVDFGMTGLEAILEKVYRDSGQDFRDYRRGTVSRRLQRRLFATGSDSYREYLALLDSHPEEYQRLIDDLTIKVSGFFRSPYTYQQVELLVLPQMVRRKGLKIWSAACARGEEPYSLAMMLAEFTGRRWQDRDSPIYATDISTTALASAQHGIYQNIEGVPVNLRAGYFHRQGEDYRVTSDLRHMVSFQRFDLLSKTSPPFAPADCIFCCNTLIYMQKPLQARVLRMLYDSLTNPGYLVLGDAEMPTNSLCEKLECLDPKAKIYRKQE